MQAMLPRRRCSSVFPAIEVTDNLKHVLRLRRRQLPDFPHNFFFCLPVKQNLIQILFCSVALLLILFSPCIYTFLLEHAYSQAKTVLIIFLLINVSVLTAHSASICQQSVYSFLEAWSYMTMSMTFIGGSAFWYFDGMVEQFRLEYLPISFCYHLPPAIILSGIASVFCTCIRKLVRCSKHKIKKP
jgi:hypothetical protein